MTWHENLGDWLISDFCYAHTIRYGSSLHRWKSIRWVEHLDSWTVEYFLHHAVIYINLNNWSSALLCKADVMCGFENIHSVMLVLSIITHMWNRQWKIKICLLHRDQCERHIYLFLLSAQGHCFHDDSLMASFASLFLFFFFFSLLSLHICNISVWRPLMTVVGLPPPFPPTVLYFSSLTPPFLKSSSLKDKMKKQSVNRLQERQCFDGLKMMQHQSVCVWVFLWQKWDWAGVASISKASILG